MRIWFGISIVYIFTRYFGIFSGIPGIFDIFVCDRFSYRRYGYEENTRYTWYIDLPTDLMLYCNTYQPALMIRINFSN